MYMYIAVSEFSYLGNIKTAMNNSSFDKQHKPPVPSQNPSCKIYHCLLNKIFLLWGLIVLHKFTRKVWAY